MKFPVVLSPIKIGAMEVKNRFVVPPMATELALPNDNPTERYTSYWAARAKGGHGLLIVEATAISPLSKGSPWNEPSIDKFIPAWKKITNEVHKYGTKITIQLHHAGRQTTHDKIEGQPVAPSPIPCPVEREMPRELAIKKPKNPRK